MASDTPRTNAWQKAYNSGGPDAPTILDFMRQLERELQQALRTGPLYQQWIPTSKRVPQENQKVLACWGDGYMYCAYYVSGEWLNSRSDVMPSQRITHWMPLPEAPK